MYPANPQLWNRLEQQVRAKYPSRNPLIGNLPFPAAKELRKQYEAAGGQFVDSKRDVDPKFRDYKDEAEQKKKKKERALARARARGEAI